MKRVILFSLILLTFDLFGQSIDTAKIKSYFGTYVGGFSIYNIKTGKSIQYNPAQCKQRFSPCSTFKIPNSLIGLETGVIPDTSFVIKYDSALHPKDPELLKTEPFKYWYKDLSLKNAFKYSSVWYYQELARRIGQERMQKYVEYFDYGNSDITSGIDSFWLCGSLEISINEQIEFLKQLYLSDFEFSEKTINAVKSIMLYETKPNYKLYGKTGGGNCLNNKTIGWYVGFVETDSGASIFAMNVIVNGFDDLKNNYRIELTKKILKDLKIIK